MQLKTAIYQESINTADKSIALLTPECQLSFLLLHGLWNGVWGDGVHIWPHSNRINSLSLLIGGALLPQTHWNVKTAWQQWGDTWFFLQRICVKESPKKKHRRYEQEGNFLFYFLFSFCVFLKPGKPSNLKWLGSKSAARVVLFGMDWLEDCPYATASPLLQAPWSAWLLVLSVAQMFRELSPLNCSLQNYYCNENPITADMYWMYFGAHINLFFHGIIYS